MLTDNEIKERLASMSGWEQMQVGEHPGIGKVFKRKNFLDGLSFVTKMAVLAEMANHHPDVLLTWPKVTVMLTTHDAGGLTDKDFELAGEIDAIS